jgi:hypothetical protein
LWVEIHCMLFLLPPPSTCIISFAAFMRTPMTANVGVLEADDSMTCEDTPQLSPSTYTMDSSRGIHAQAGLRDPRPAGPWQARVAIARRLRRDARPAQRHPPVETVHTGVRQSPRHSFADLQLEALTF